MEGKAENERNGTQRQLKAQQVNAAAENPRATVAPKRCQFVKESVFCERREVHTKFKLVPSKYHRAHQAALFNPPLVPKLDKRNVGEPPTRPWFDNDIEHLLLLKFAMMYPNTPDCGKETTASFV